VDKKAKDSNYRKMISYSMLNPINGKKLPADELCKDDKVVVQENLMSKLNDTNLDINSLLDLTGQNINIFNLSSDFYTDICYHYESNLNKDVALRDRILIYFPNITLCEGGCETKGVNVTTLKAICECVFNSLKDNAILSNNILYQSQLGQIEEMISSTNIVIIKCYEDIFKYKYFISSIGGFIILGLILTQIIVSILYSINSLYYIRKYLFEISNKFILYIANPNNIIQSNNSISVFDNDYMKKNNPPKKENQILEKNNPNANEKKKTIKRIKAKRKTSIKSDIKQSNNLKGKFNINKDNIDDNNNMINQNNKITINPKNSEKDDILVLSSNSINNSIENQKKRRNIKKN
jgi:hypothetical protein